MCCAVLTSSLLILVPILSAQELPKSQPPLWAAKPDVAAFESMENDRLAAAQPAIDEIVAVKGPRTIDNTLAPYDEATRQLNAAATFPVGCSKCIRMRRSAITRPP